MGSYSKLKSVIPQRVSKTMKGISRFCKLGLLTTMLGMMALPAMAVQQAPEEVIDRIIAIVNNDIILLSEIERTLIPYIKNIKGRRLPQETEGMMISRARDDIRDNLINEKLITQKATGSGIMVDEEEVNAALEQMKKSMLYSEEKFRAFLHEMGYTTDDYRQQIRNQILKSKLLRQEIKSKTVVTTEEIKDYYQKHREEFAPGTQYHLKHIIMQITKDADPAKRETIREKMEEVHRQIQDGAPFESLAKEYSQSSFADVGGDLGLFSEADLSPELKEPIIRTREGEITPVIETDSGYQIFYIQAVIKNDGSLNDDVSDTIREKLYNEKLDEKFNSWINQLRDSSHIKIIE